MTHFRVQRAVAGGDLDGAAIIHKDSLFESGPQAELIFADAPRMMLYNGGDVLIEAGAE